METAAKEGAPPKRTMLPLPVTDFCSCGEECHEINVSPPAHNYDSNKESEAEIAEFLQGIKIIKILNVT